MKIGIIPTTKQKNHLQKATIAFLLSSYLAFAVVSSQTKKKRVGVGFAVKLPQSDSNKTKRK